MSTEQDPIRAALKDMLYSAEANPSCQKRRLVNCRCRGCCIVRAREALAQAPAPQPQTAAEVEARNMRLSNWEVDALTSGSVDSQEACDAAASEPVAWQGLTQDERHQAVNALVDYGTGFVAPLYSVIEGVERKLMERNVAPSPVPAPQASPAQEARKVLQAILFPSGRACVSSLQREHRMRYHDAQRLLGVLAADGYLDGLDMSPMIQRKMHAAKSSTKKEDDAPKTCPSGRPVHSGDALGRCFDCMWSGKLTCSTAPPIEAHASQAQHRPDEKDQSPRPQSGTDGEVR